MKRIAFLHTVGFLVDEFRSQMRETLPDVDAFHVLNEGLLQDLLRGAAQADVYERVVRQIQLVAETSAEMIVVTCSSTSPAVDLARRVVEKPILKIDDPMAEAAVRQGTRITLVCTATSTLGASTRLLEDWARKAGRPVVIHPLLQADAYAALLRGDRRSHDALVVEATRAAASDADVVVLAQASLAHLRSELAEELACPVLASPPLLMQEIARRTREP